MEKANKKPEVRFKGFTDDWGAQRLGDISEIGDGLHGTPKYVEDGGVYFINGNNLISGKIVVNNETKQVTETEQSKDDKRLNTNTILMSINGTIGNLAWYRGEKIMLGKSAAYITLKNHDKNFVYVYLQTTKMHNYFFNNLTGSTIKNLGLKTIRDSELVIPKIEEQTKIGTYFKNLDHLITLRQQKYDKLVTIKKSMLEKMFPKNGALVPEIRFKGFSGAWEERELGEVGYTYTGLSGKTKDDFGHGEGRFITYMNVFSNSITNPKLIESVEVDSKQNEVKVGDVFFTTSSETPEEVGMSSVWLKGGSNMYLNSFCFGYRPVEEFDHYYLAYMLRSSSIRKKITFLGQGISRYNISKNKVMEISIPIPNIKEQSKIGNYFKTLDNLITLHQTELKKLKNIKKACLKKMFV